MSSHSRPAHRPGPTDPYASGEGAYGDGPYSDGGHGGGSSGGYSDGGYEQGYGVAYGQAHGQVYGDAYQDLTQGQQQGQGYYQAPAPQVYGEPYQDAGQAYATQGYPSSYPDGGHTAPAYYAGYSAYPADSYGAPADAGYGQSGYADSGYGEAGYPAAAEAAPYAEPAAPEPPPSDRPPSRAAASRTGSRVQVRAAAKARARRGRRVRNSFLGVGSVAAVTIIAVAAFLHPGTQKPTALAAASPTVDSGRGNGSSLADASRSVNRPTPVTALTQLPGLGASFRAKVPANAQQVLLVTGAGKSADTSTAVLYTRTADGSWLPGTAWAAHNAKDGWTSHHMAGDLHSPIGVYSLTAAGGLDANPGTKLPYLHSSAFKALGTGFEGESLADAFDYVVAIDYNHDPGTSPLSADRPLGASRGGGIWVHVDHGGPTHGCVSLSKANMAILLKDLDPAKHPVIVMGDAASLRA